MTISMEEYPAQLSHAPTNALKVTKKLQQLYPGLVPRDLPSVTTEGRFLVKTPSEIMATNPLHPPYIIARFDQLVKPHIERDLILAWDNLNATDVRFPPPDPNRSKTPALHLGVWELYSSQPHITGDTRKQSSAAIVAMDKLLCLIGKSIGPKLSNILKSHYPILFHRQSL